MTLPEVERPRPSSARAHRKEKHSFASGIADLVIEAYSCLSLAACWRSRLHPYLIVGPGMKVLHDTPFALTGWHVIYWQFLGLLIATCLPSRLRYYCLQQYVTERRT